MKRLAAVLSLAALAACSKTTPPARAFKIESRADLIGGKRALGEVGDFKLSNGVVHAIVQDVGYSRGFGAFGGSLIDIDLVRANQATGATGTKGNDYFTEMFPAFFLTAVEPSKVEVVADGRDGGPAIIRASGRGNAFLSMVRPITDLVLDPKLPLDYSCDYILEPGKQYVKVEVTITNPGPAEGGFALPMPLGAVTLLGEGQSLFIPGAAGFDIRYHLEDVIYKQPAALDALPGVVTPMWTTAGDGVSYAFAVARPRGGTYLDLDNPDDREKQRKATYYPAAGRNDMLLPIAYSSFLGAFWANAPKVLKKGEKFTYAGYLAVGSGDVASVQRVVYELRDVEQVGARERVLHDKTPYGTVSGLVRDADTAQGLEGVSVVLQDDKGHYQSQAQTVKGGRFSAPVPPGKYRAYAVDPVRSVAVSEGLVEVAEGGAATLTLALSQPGHLQVVVRDADGRALPAKISVEGGYENDKPGELPRRVLYDLAVGEPYRISDMVPDDPADPATRRYLEKVFYAASGSGGRALRPGRYTVWASRGMEYDLEKQEVEIRAGHTTAQGFTLTQVMPTPGWVSGDFHVHSVKSVDSNMGLEDRVTSFAVEGVDFLAATDHNYVVDYQPTIDALGLSDWLKSSVGLELTSLEMGHFNAFPLKVEPGPVTHGSFRWFMRPPGELFAQLRGLGKVPQKTIIHVNHPRDTIMGYFNAFNVGTYVAKPIPPTSSFVLDTRPLPNGEPSPYVPENFSLDFDAFEVFNGKRLDNMLTYRMPATPPPGPEPSLPRCPAGGITDTDCLPAAGEVLERVVTNPDGGALQLTPAFPGSMDDWFTLLAQGRRVTATGNSDSHGPKSEAGLPRTYLQLDDAKLADGSMRALPEDAVYDALREGRALVTNGPFIEVKARRADSSDAWVGPGHTVVAPDGAVELELTVAAAPWVDVKRVVVRRGGKDMVKFPAVLETIPVVTEGVVRRLQVTKRYANVPDDSFLVVEASGDRSMWPVNTPHEITSVQISDAVGVIGSSFGFSSKYGKYGPTQDQYATPYAFTNPVYVTRSNKQGLTAPKRVLPVSASEPFTPRTVPDLRRLLGSMHTDLE